MNLDSHNFYHSMLNISPIISNMAQDPNIITPNNLYKTLSLNALYTPSNILLRPLIHIIYNKNETVSLIIRLAITYTVNSVIYYACSHPHSPKNNTIYSISTLTPLTIVITKIYAKIQSNIPSKILVSSTSVMDLLLYSNTPLPLISSLYPYSLPTSSITLSNIFPLIPTYYIYSLNT